MFDLPTVGFLAYVYIYCQDDVQGNSDGDDPQEFIDNYSIYLIIFNQDVIRI